MKDQVRHPTAYQSGLDGEQLADFLIQQGMTLVDRRVRLGTGEIDLVMTAGDTVVFVEVKFRPASAAGSGLMAVHQGKITRMLDCATRYLTQQGWLVRPIRFDVVEITRDGIIHVPNAFQG